MARLPGDIDERGFLSALARFGWTVENQRGSHRKLWHADGRVLRVAFHNVIRRNAVRHTLRLAGIDEEAPSESCELSA